MSTKYSLHRIVSYISQKVIKWFCIFSGLTICIYFFFTIFYMPLIFSDIAGKAYLIEATVNLFYPGDALIYIRQDTVRLWDTRDFLIVFGIPSLDIPKRRWRRHMQRISCWQFPEVATRHNNYTGAMLVLYLLAKHPVNNYVLSDTVVEEALQWQDTLLHPTHEGRCTTSKIRDGRGKWGMEGEIGSSRKTFFWFQFALQQFPRVPYVGKGDDDSFIRVPQYLADLRQLPLRGVYWGRYNVGNDTVRKERRERVEHMSGYCFTLSSDVARQFVSYEPLRKIIWKPYNSSILYDFLFFSMRHEDVMVGRVLGLTGYPLTLFAEYRSRFAIGVNPMFFKVGVAAHHLLEHEYYFFMGHFLSNVTTPTRIVMIKKRPRFVVVRPLLNK